MIIKNIDKDINFDDKSSSNVVNVAKSRLIQYSKLTYVTNISEVDALVEFTNSNFYWELILNLANSKANVSISNWTSDTAAKGIINSANITINGIKISLSNFTPAYAELNKTISFDNSSCQQLNQFTLFSTLNIKIK